MQLQLSAFERIQIMISLPRNCERSEIAQLLRIDDAVALSPAEKEQFEYKVVKLPETPQGPVTFIDYDETAEGLHDQIKTVEIDGVEDFKRLHEVCMARPRWPRCREAIAFLDMLDEKMKAIKEQEKSGKKKGDG